MIYRGFVIEKVDGGFVWENMTTVFSTIEDAEYSIECFMWEEIEAEKERREDDYLLTR